LPICYIKCISSNSTLNDYKKRGGGAVIVIDYKDSRPIYEQVVEKFQALIVKKVLEADSQMPSVRSLAMELSINPNTIQKAYAELERRGFVYTVKGRGCFVSASTDYLGYKTEELRRRIDEIIKESADIGISREKVADYILGKELKL